MTSVVSGNPRPTVSLSRFRRGLTDGGGEDLDDPNDAVGSGTLFERIRARSGNAGEWDMVFSSSGLAGRRPAGFGGAPTVRERHARLHQESSSAAAVVPDIPAHAALDR